MCSVLSEHDRELIVENWIRILISSDVSLNDIIQIVVQYGNQFPQFDSSLSMSKSVKFDNGNLAVRGIKLYIHI